VLIDRNNRYGSGYSTLSRRTKPLYRLWSSFLPNIILLQINRILAFRCQKYLSNFMYGFFSWRRVHSHPHLRHHCKYTRRKEVFAIIQYITFRLLGLALPIVCLVCASTCQCGFMIHDSSRSSHTNFVALLDNRWSRSTITIVRFYRSSATTGRRRCDCTWSCCILCSTASR
jgi:hypothetical protein